MPVEWLDSIAQHARANSLLDFTSAVTAGLLTSIGIWVSVTPPAKARRWRFVCAFVVLGLIAVVAQLWQMADVRIEAAKADSEAKRNTLGDPEHPPYVAVASLPAVTRFIITNASDYPVYGTKIRAYEDTPGGPHRTFDWSYPEMGPHIAFMDDAPWVATDHLLQRHFTITIATRTGFVTEEMLLRPAGNNQWMRALRVRRGQRILVEDIDSDWPRNRDGSINW